MTRYAKRTDDNQSSLITELKIALHDATIFDASGAGKGFPDLVVGWKGRNYMIEIKDPEKCPSSRKLTPAQEKLHLSWQGQINVCHSAADVIATILRIETA